MSDALANYNNPFMAAMAIGFSCGTTCSPLVNLFLTTYTMSRFNSTRQGLRAFAYFWLGKTAVVSVLSFLSAVVGRAIISQNGRSVGFDLRLVWDSGLIFTGICLLTIILRRKRPVTACDNCGASCRPTQATGRWPLVAMGAAYGLTPCTPLLLLLLMVAMLPPIQAVEVSLIFTLANSVSPLLFSTALAGFVSQKMHQEIPQLIRVFQIMVFGSFIIIGIISLFGHLQRPPLTPLSPPSSFREKGERPIVSTAPSLTREVHPNPHACRRRKTG
jgi:hypothetical protein